MCTYGCVNNARITFLATPTTFDEFTVCMQTPFWLVDLQVSVKCNLCMRCVFISVQRGFV